MRRVDFMFFSPMKIGKLSLRRTWEEVVKRDFMVNKKFSELLVFYCMTMSNPVCDQCSRANIVG